MPAPVRTARTARTAVAALLLALAIPAGAGALLGAAGCGGGPRTAAPAGAPVIRLRLPALDGGTVDTRRYAGRVVVLHLFESAAPAASFDVEQLEALRRAEPDRVAVIGVAIDPAGYRLVAAWRRAVGAGYLIALGGEALRTGKGPLGTIATVPSTVILDRRGAVAHRIERPLAEGELARLVTPLLGR